MISLLGVVPLDPSESHAHLLVWVIVTVGVPIITMLGGIFILLYRTNANARDANDAVNHRHKKIDSDGNEPPKLYDAVLEGMNHQIEVNKRLLKNDRDHEYIIGRLHELEKTFPQEQKEH